MYDAYTLICPNCGYMSPEGRNYHTEHCPDCMQITVIELKKRAKQAGVELVEDGRFIGGDSPEERAETCKKIFRLNEGYHKNSNV